MWFPDDPQLLRRNYIVRTTLLRLALLWTAVYGLDSALQGQHNCHHSSSRCKFWSWQQRVGLAGVLLQLVLTAWSVVWPFLHMLSYEQHHRRLQNVLAYSTILGTALQLSSNMAPTALAAACQRAMVLHSLLFALQQDQCFPQYLAAMLVTYSCCHVLAGRQSLLAAAMSGKAYESAPAEAAFGSSSSSSSSTESSGDVVSSILAASKFYLAQYMIALLLYQAVVRLAPAPEKLAAQGRGSRNSGTPSRGSRCSTTSYLSASSGAESPRASVCSKATRNASYSATSGSSRQQLGPAYKLKLAVIKAMDAMFLAVLAVHYWCTAGRQSSHLADTVEEMGADLVASSSQAMLKPSLVTAAVAALQLAHAVSLYIAPKCFVVQPSMSNAVFFWPGVALRGWLMLGQSWAASPAAVAAADGGTLSVPPGQVFAAFVALVMSLASQEETYLSFTSQLTLLAAGMRHAHLQTLTGDMRRAGGAAAFLQLPEYLVLCVLASCCYTGVCLGKDPQQNDALTSTSNSRASTRRFLQRSTSSQAASLSLGTVVEAEEEQQLIEEQQLRQMSAAQLANRRRSMQPLVALTPGSQSAYTGLQVDVGQSMEEEHAVPPVLQTPPFSSSAAPGLTCYEGALSASPRPAAVAAQQEQAAGGAAAGSAHKGRRRSILWADTASSLEQAAKEQLSNETHGQGPATSSGGPIHGSTVVACKGRPHAVGQVAGAAEHADAGSRQQPSTAALPRNLSRSSSQQQRSTAAGIPLDRHSGANTAEADSSDDAPVLQVERRIFLDFLLCAMSMPVLAAAALELLSVAWLGSTDAGPVGRGLGAVAACIHLLAAVPFLASILWNARAAYAQRVLLSSRMMSVGPCSLEAANHLLRLPPTPGIRGRLVVLASGMGLAQMPTPAFIAWLPLMFVTFSCSHIYHNWATLTRAKLAVDMMEFNLLPVSEYVLVSRAMDYMDGTLETFIPTVLRRLGVKHKKLYRVLAVALGSLIQLVVSNMLTTLLLLGPQHMPQSMNPFIALETAKTTLLTGVEHLFRTETMEVVLPAACVLLCLLAVPGTHLLAAWLWTHQSKPADAAVSHNSNAGQQELKRQVQLAIDDAAYVGSLPLILFLVPKAVIASLWPAPGVLLWHRLLATGSAVAFGAALLLSMWERRKNPLVALARRHVWWGLTHSCLPSVIQVGNALVKTTGFWPPLLESLLFASSVGLMELRHAAYAVSMTVATTCSFAAYVYTNWGATSWTLMAYEAVEFGLYPTVVYGMCRLLIPALNRTAVRFTMEAALQRGWITTPEQHKQWTVWSSMISIMVVAVGPVWSVALGVKLPAYLDVGAATDALKMEVVGMLGRMDFNITAQMDTLQTLLAMAGVGLCFLAVSSVQALVLNNPAFSNPRQRKYEACKAQVLLLGERTMSSLTQLGPTAGPQQLREALLCTLRELTDGCFPGCTLLVVLMEDKDSLYLGMAQRHLVHAAPEAADMPEHDLMAVSELSSVIQACQQGTILYESSAQPGATGHGDWDALAADYGMDGFLVAPLSCADRAMGALLLTSTSPVSLDRYMRKLAGDLAPALSQALYTLSCIEQMKAGEQIIHDILPEKVAEELRRRAATADSSAWSPKTPRAPSSPLQHTGLFADCPDKSPTGMLLHSHSGQQGSDWGQRSSRSRMIVAGSAAGPASLSGFGQVPVVYKQWHPAVTVLFADISSYTAMSQQVEPEQVMQLLHELFSKYDNLCSHFNVYKVETIGDCYMACCGLLTDDPDHANNMVQFGQAMLGAAASVSHPLGGHVRIRVGVHSGRVMSGVVGSIRARYCLFGDTVNTASRMESTGVVDHIQVTEDTYQLLLSDLQQDFNLRDPVAVKGKGVMHTYLLRSEVADRLQQDPLDSLWSPPI